MSEKDRVIYEGHLKLVKRRFDGRDYDVVVSKDAAAMLYIDEKDQVYFTTQYRPALEEEVLAMEINIREIEKEIDSGKFMFDEKLEDVHMNIESALINKIGNVFTLWQVTGKRRRTIQNHDQSTRLQFRYQHLCNLANHGIGDGQNDHLRILDGIIKGHRGSAHFSV